MTKNIITNDFKDFFSYLNESLPDGISYLNLSRECKLNSV